MRTKFFFGMRNIALSVSLAYARSNEELVSAHNSNPDRSYDLTTDGPFGKTSWSEFKSTILMEPQDCSATIGRKSSVSTDPLPDKFDWRDRGVVSEVKNQGHCGSCWTFSTTGALEAHTAIYHGIWRAPRLSEQQLISCAGSFDNHGCSGGLPSHAFEYIHHAGGLSREFAYPYEALDSQCKFSSANSSIVGATTIRSFNITEGDEDSLMHELVRKGPVSVAFEVVDDFRLYKSGVYSSTSCKSGPKDVNHAVLVIGYGVENGLPYWLVKNSWGTSWGEEGYFKMARGKNMCGIATCASFPVIEEEVTEDDRYLIFDA